MKSAQALEDSYRFMARIGENIGDGVVATDKQAPSFSPTPRRCG